MGSEPDSDAAGALRAAALAVDAEDGGAGGAGGAGAAPEPVLSPTSEGLRMAAAEVVDARGGHDNEEEEEDAYEDDFASEGGGTALSKSTGGREAARSTLLEAVAAVDADEAAAHGKSLVDVVREMDAEAGGAGAAAEQVEEAGDEEDGDFESDDSAEASDGLPVLDDSGGAQLLRLAFHGKTGRAKDLLNGKASEAGVQRYSVNGVADRHGWTPLHWAASRGHVRFCQWLLQRGARANAREATSGWTPLHVAAIGTHVDVARVLIEDGGASARRADKYGDIPHECVCRPLKGDAGDRARELRKLLRPQLKARRGSDKNNDENTRRSEN